MAAKFLNGVDANNQNITNVADPSSNTHAANKQYVDNKIAGLSWKEEVRVATTANGTLASAFANGQSVDGQSLVTGDRILLKNQSAQAENGIYTVNVSGAPTRATDADTTTDLNNATVSVTDGTVNGGLAYTQSTKNPTVGSSNIVWVVFGAGSAYSADGSGIELSSTTFSLELDGITLAKSSSGLRIGSGAAGAGLVEATGVLAVGAGAGISVAADAVAVDTAVVARKGTAQTTTANPWVIAHGAGSAALSFTIRETSTGIVVFADVVVDATNITVTFPVAPTSDQYRIFWVF